MNPPTSKHFLMASDFDQTLSFNDSGMVLAEILGVRNFEQKVAGLAHSNLVQQGGELAYLIRHDPEFRGVRREHLAETRPTRTLERCHQAVGRFPGAGRQRLSFLFLRHFGGAQGSRGCGLGRNRFAGSYFGTELNYDPHSGEVRSVMRVPAGYGKVAVLEELERRLNIAPDRTIYVGDGSSDVHVMLHVNNRDGFTIAVSENLQLARIAKSTVLSDHAFSVLVPVLDQLLGWRIGQIRALFEAHGLTLHEWERARTDRVLIGETAMPTPAVA